MIPSATLGTLQVLNVNQGDMKLSFDASNPSEVERAKRVVEDMLKRGFVLFVDEGDGKLKRVKRFNAKKCSYVIADSPSEGVLDENREVASEDKAEKKKRGRPPKTREVSASKARTYGVSRTAGG